MKFSPCYRGRVGRFARTDRSLYCRRPPVPLDLRPSSLPLDPPLRAPHGPGRPPRDRRNQRLAQQGGETLPRRGPVLPRGAVISGADRQGSARKYAGAVVQGPFALRVDQRSRRGEGRADLHPGVGGVNALGAWPEARESCPTSSPAGIRRLWDAPGPDDTCSSSTRPSSTRLVCRTSRRLASAPVGGCSDDRKARGARPERRVRPSRALRPRSI